MTFSESRHQLFKSPYSKGFFFLSDFGSNIFSNTNPE